MPLNVVAASQTCQFCIVDCVVKILQLLLLILPIRVAGSSLELCVMAGVRSVLLESDLQTVVKIHQHTNMILMLLPDLAVT